MLEPEVNDVKIFHFNHKKFHGFFNGGLFNYLDDNSRWRKILSKITAENLSSLTQPYIYSELKCEIISTAKKNQLHPNYLSLMTDFLTSRILDRMDLEKDVEFVAKKIHEDHDCRLKEIKNLYEDQLNKVRKFAHDHFLCLQATSDFKRGISETEPLTGRKGSTLISERRSQLLSHRKYYTANRNSEMKTQGNAYLVTGLTSSPLLNPEFKSDANAYLVTGLTSSPLLANPSKMKVDLDQNSEMASTDDYKSETDAYLSSVDGESVILESSDDGMVHSFYLIVDIKGCLKDAERKNWEIQLLEDRKTISDFLLNATIPASNLTDGLAHEDVAFFLRVGSVLDDTSQNVENTVSFTEFVINLYESFAAQDNSFLEKIFCREVRQKVIFPEANSDSDKIKVTYDIDSISFTGNYFPFKSESSITIPLKIRLSPSQFRNISNDTCVRMLDPVTDVMRPIRYFKHTYLLDIYGFGGFIFFPWLHVDQRSLPHFNNFMLNEDFNNFIEWILLPCVKAAKENGTFPDNVKPKNQYKGINSNKFNSLQFPVELFGKVVQDMRAKTLHPENVKMHCFKDFFFHFQCIGIKNIYKGSKEETMEKLLNFLEHFVDTNCEVKSYFDIGVEFYFENGAEKQTVFWSKEGAEALYYGLDRRGSVTRSSNLYSSELLGTYKE